MASTSPTNPLVPNPVATPNVSGTTGAPASPVNSQGLTVAQMIAAAENRAYNTPTTSIAAPKAPTAASTTVQPPSPAPAVMSSLNAPGVPAGPAPGQVTGPVPVQVGTNLQNQTFQASMPQERSEKQISEVMRLNGISREDAQKRIQNSQDSQAGLIPQSPVPGAAYDPATNSFRDPLTRTFYAGFDPKLGHVFTADQRMEVAKLSQPPESGIITTDEFRTAVNTVGTAINTAMMNPLPSSGTTGVNGANVNGTADSLTASLPPELQVLQQELDAMKGQTEDNPFDEYRKRFEQRYANQVQDIEAGARTAREEQAQANKEALARVEVFFANSGALNGSQHLQFVGDTIRQGEKALNAISNAERKNLNDAFAAFQDQDFQLAVAEMEKADEKRKEYRDMTMQLFTLKENYQDMLLNRQAKRMEMQSLQRADAVESMQLMIDAGASVDDIPPETLAQWESQAGLPAGTGRTYFQTVENQRLLENAKTQAEAKKATYGLYVDGMKLALDTPPEMEVVIPMPDGTTITVPGFKDVSEDWKATAIKTPAGQYLVYTDQRGQVMNRTRIGDLEPYFDAVTGEFVSYDPTTDQENVVFRGGEYGEGYAGMDVAASYIEGLLAQGRRITQEPGDEHSHGNLTGWDIGNLPVGTELLAPMQNGVVVGMGFENRNFSENPGGMKAYGNYVDIMDADTGAIFRMAHLSEINVEKMQNVNAQTIIGKSGNTGRSSGPHLHLEVLDSKGKAIVPGQGTPASKSKINATPEEIAAYTKETGRTFFPNSNVTVNEFSAWKKDKEKTTSRPLESGQAKLLADGMYLSTGPLLGDLATLIETNKNLFDPIKGMAFELNPYGEGIRVQDDLKRATQTIGAYLEGGVLRAEDEKKYKAMLPQLTDTYKTAIDKLTGIKKLLTQKQSEYLSANAAAGYDISGFLPRAPQIQLEPGYVWVQDKQGNIGSISESEFSPTLYFKLQ